jgi:hypothetical protein
MSSDFNFQVALSRESFNELYTLTTGLKWNTYITSANTSNSHTNQHALSWWYRLPIIALLQFNWFRSNLYLVQTKTSQSFIGENNSFGSHFSNFSVNKGKIDNKIFLSYYAHVYVWEIPKPYEVLKAKIVNHALPSG